MYNNNIKKLTYLDYSKWEAMQNLEWALKKAVSCEIAAFCFMNS